MVYPSRSEPSSFNIPAAIENAKAVCRQCDAQSDCLDFALATNQDSGIWGGTSEEERRKLRKQYAARQRRTA